MGQRMSRKVGRPRQEGRERYPSGQVKPDGISPTLWARMRTHGVKQQSNPLVTTQIGRLSFYSQLTNEQTAAAFRIGDTCRRYHRYMQLKESPKSPNHDQGDGAAGLAEKRNDETGRSIENNLCAAEAAWRVIDDMLAGLSRNIRQAILDLCVDDLPINSLLLPDIRRFLDHLARKWADEWRKQKRPIEPAVRLAPMIVEKAKAKPQRDIDAVAFQALVRKLRPDLNADRVSMLTDKFLASRDRELFRAEKVMAR